MVLSGNMIQAQLGDGLDIVPFNQSQLGPNSYNLTLNPVLKVFEEGQVLDLRVPPKTRDIIIPEEGLMLYPGILYLGSTNEFTSTTKYRPCLDGRSSIARYGVCIHVTAGYGDVGFNGRWTLEISVVEPVRIYPNIEFCQISYEEVIGKITPYNGKYQNSQGTVASKMSMDFQKRNNL